MNVNRVWLITGLTIILASFMTVMWFWVLDTEEPVNRLVRREDPEVLSVAEPQQQIYPATVVMATTEYSLCGHSTVYSHRGEAEFVGQTYAGLAAAGWRVAPQKNGNVELYRTADELCPADSKKRCIRRTANGIGVYTGSLAAQGELLYELQMDLTLLPEDWQSKLELTAGFEFADETELFRMLENLDEYVADTEEMVLSEAFPFGE